MGAIQGDGRIVHLKGQVATLYDPDLVVEFATVAEIPRERFRRPS